MDLEAREIPIQSRAMYNSRLKSYKQEVEKLEKDFVSTTPPRTLVNGHADVPNEEAHRRHLDENPSFQSGAFKMCVCRGNI